MKFFFAIFLLGLVGMAMADVKTTPVVVGAAAVQTTPLVVTDVSKSITVQQAAQPSPLVRPCPPSSASSSYPGVI